MTNAPGTTGGLKDKLLGKAKQAAGSLLDDEKLQQEGQLHEDKAETAEEARQLEARAEQERQQAEVASAGARIEAERQELAAEQAAAQTQTVRSFQRKRPSRKPFPEHLPRERVVIAAPKAVPAADRPSCRSWART